MKKRKNRKQNMYNSIQHPLLSVDIIESAIQGEKWAKQKIIKQHQTGLCFFVKVVYNKIAVRVRPYGPCTSSSFYGKCFQEP